MDTCGHDTRCINATIQSIADNNAWTMARGDAHDIANMPTETAETAIEWLANGNAACWMDGDYCTPTHAV